MTTPLFHKGLRPGLYAITDSQLLPGDALLPAVEAALKGGATLVQYRDKILSPVDRRTQALGLNELCRHYQVPLIINDDPQLALACNAAGVHLGQDDLAIDDARALLGQEAIIGATCHGDLTLAERAAVAGADYLAFGRFHSSSTKPGAPGADPEILAQAAPWQLPRTAIGGVTLDNGGNLIRCGADLLAVVGGLFAAPADQVEQRARSFTRLFATHHPFFNL